MTKIGLDDLYPFSPPPPPALPAVPEVNSILYKGVEEEGDGKAEQGERNGGLKNGYLLLHLAPGPRRSRWCHVFDLPANSTKFSGFLFKRHINHCVPLNPKFSLVRGHTLVLPVSHLIPLGVRTWSLSKVWTGCWASGGQSTWNVGSLWNVGSSSHRICRRHCCCGMPSRFCPCPSPFSKAYAFLRNWSDTLLQMQAVQHFRNRRFPRAIHFCSSLAWL